MKGGAGGGKWGEAALGPEPCVFGGGKGIMSFIRLLPGVLSDWTFPSSGRLQTVPSRSLMLPFCLPWVHALVDLPSKTGSTVSSVCVCVCVWAHSGLCMNPPLRAGTQLVEKVIELIQECYLVVRELLSSIRHLSETGSRILSPAIKNNNSNSKAMLGTAWSGSTWCE